MRSLFLLLAAVTCVAGLVHAQSKGIAVTGTGVSGAGKRVALIVGNAKYVKAPGLNNPPNDARLMERTLRNLGFETTLLLDAGNKEMVQAIDAFSDKLRRAEVGLFYYSGHGMQVKGENYLIPVDATLERESNAQFEAVNAKRVLGAMADAGNPVNVVILDACRNNPFGKSFRSLGRGLAAMSAQGTLIAYATGADTVAQDGDGSNSPYTASLARHLSEPNISVADVFGSVSGDVQKQSGGQQVPFIYSSLTGRLVLLEKETAPPPRPAPATPTVDPATEAWAMVKESTNPDDFSDFAKTFSGSPLAATAKFREQQLRRAAAPAPPPQQAAVQTPSSGTTFRDPTTGMEFVAIPGGEYEQGCHANAGECFESEKPSRSVKLRPFWLGKTTVTRGAFAQFVRDSAYTTDGEKTGGCWVYTGSKWEKLADKNWRNPGFAQVDTHPVTCVTWNDAQAFAQWLSGKGGQRYRLPTEAEWEYACRSGGKSVMYGTNSGHLRADNANFLGTVGSTSPVTRFPPNDLGLFDMSSNVWQWTQDVYDEKAYRSGTADNPVVEGSGAKRVSRGGGWTHGGPYLRCSFRGANAPSNGYYNIGFRLARNQ